MDPDLTHLSLSGAAIMGKKKPLRGIKQDMAEESLISSTTTCFINDGFNPREINVRSIIAFFQKDIMYESKSLS